MFLYLVQHGEALSEQENPERPLSMRGKETVTKVAEYLAQLNIVKIDQILHSEKLRAKETAEILNGYLKPPKGIKETTGLAPLDSPQIWAKRLAKIDEDLMCVGHLPHLSKFASLLLSGDESRNIINFKMGGVVCLQRREDNWTIEWILSPELVGR